MSAEGQKAIAAMAEIGAAIRAARQRGAPWKDLIEQFGLCRTRLYQLAKQDARGHENIRICRKLLLKQRKKQKCS
jgi:hypothetical protein